MVKHPFKVVESERKPHSQHYQSQSARKKKVGKESAIAHSQFCYIPINIFKVLWLGSKQKLTEIRIQIVNCFSFNLLLLVTDDSFIIDF